MNKRHMIVGMLACAGTAASVLAQPTVFTQWNFNTGATSAVNNNPAPTVGSGQAIPLGMTNNFTYTLTPPFVGSITACDLATAGASSDIANSPNLCWRVRGSTAGTFATAGIGWHTGAAQFTQGARFNVSTVNYNAIALRFDIFCTNQGINNMQVQYTLNGTTWTSIGPVFDLPADGWINNNVIDFSSVSGASDNPNFGVRLVAVHDPNYVGPGAPTYTGASGGVYNNRSGNWRFDAVTFTGTPFRAIGPTGTLAIDTPAVCSSGGALTLTANTASGALPASTGVTVTANLSAIGLSASAPMFDNGTNGDQFAGDGVFTLAVNTPAGVALGTANIIATIADAQGRSGSANASITVGDCSTLSNSRVVISQAFGGGGNLGATPAEDAPFDADFVELFNRSNQTIDLTGWSVQYAGPTSAGGFDNAQDRVNLAGLIRPGQRLLVRMSDPVVGFTPLPAPDFAQLPGLGGMGNTGGRVALVRSTTLVGTNCTDASIEDLVGYGNATCFEGVAPTRATANNTAAVRKLNGSQDTNQSFNDFAIASPTPGNRSSNGFLASYPALDRAAACAGDSVLLTARVVPGFTSTNIAVNADVSEIVGSTSTVALLDNGANGDVTAGDGVYSRLYTLPASAAQGVRTIVINTTDAQGSSDAARVSFSVGNCSPSAAPVVISQIFGGGGNTDSGFNADFIEIFNRSGQSVNLTGWTVQYKRVTDVEGFTNRIVFLGGTIEAGAYRLIRTSADLIGGAPIPTPDFVATPAFGLDNVTGVVALVNSTVPQGTACTGPQFIDLVGYGVLATCVEGVGAAPNLTNALVAVRKDDGCQDLNQSAIDFDAVLALTNPRNSASPTRSCPPLPTLCGTADFDGDGDSGTDADIESFFACLAGTCCETCFGADFDNDGDTGTDADIEAFFRVLAGQPC